MKLRRTDRLVLKAIRELIKDNPEVSRGTIADFSEVCLRTVSLSIARLRNGGYITVKRENGKPYVFEVLKASGNGDTP